MYLPHIVVSGLAEKNDPEHLTAKILVNVNVVYMELALFPNCSEGDSQGIN
jgi:hypothetical protein